MRALLVVLIDPPLRDLPNILQALEQVCVKNLVPVGLVEPLDECVLIRLAGLNVPQFHSVLLAPVNEHLAQKLGGPLSQRIVWGRPRQYFKRSNTCTTRSPGSDVSTSMSNISLTPSSSTFSVLKRLPLYSVSCMKSRDQITLGFAGASMGNGSLVGILFFVFRLMFRPSSR